jgi:1-acyl-sn-glycerol-3-phosphate acyltransferase
MTPKRSVVRGTWRACLFLLLTAVLVPPYLVCRGLRPSWAWKVARTWNRGCVRIAGLVIRRYGRPCESRPALLVSNHVSYLDVPVLGAAVDCVFVAKREVASWPLIGYLARIARTVFIDRIAAQAPAQCKLLRKRLRRGDNLLLFPEGTSSDGSALLPFKSSLFEAASEESACTSAQIQPISIAYARFRGGGAFEGDERLLYAWCGEAIMLPHLWSVLTLPGAEVILHFHPPVRPEAFASRKELADYARRMIAGGLESSLRGARPGLIADDAEVDERPAIASS